MKVLVSTVPNNEHGDTDGFDFGILDLTPELAKLIIDRRRVLLEARETDQALSTMRFYSDGQIEYYKWPDEVDLETNLAFFDFLKELLDGASFVVLPDDAVIPEFLNDSVEDENGFSVGYQATSDVEYLDVASDYFYWVAYSTGSDVVIETALLDFNNGLLSRVL